VLHRHVNKAPHARKVEDIIKDAVHLPPAKAQQGTIEVDVLSAAEIRVEAGPQFQQRPQRAVDLDLP